MSWPGNVIAGAPFNLADYQTLVDGTRPSGSNAVPPVAPKAKAKAEASAPTGALLL